MPDVSAVYDDLGLQRTVDFDTPVDDASGEEAANSGSSGGAGTGPNGRSVDDTSAPGSWSRGGQGGTGGGGGAAAGAVLGTILQLAGWAILAVAVGAVLFWLVKLIQGIRVPVRAAVDPSSKRATSADLASSAPTVLPVDQCRAAAVRAAETGDFVRATHILLLGGLQLVTGRTHTQLVDAHTSRELLREVPADSPGRDRLERLVALTERGMFAGRPLGSGEADEAFAAYDALRGRGT